MAAGRQVNCFASAARTATPTPFTSEVKPGKYTGLQIFICTTAAGSSPSTTFAVQFKDPLSDTWVTKLVSAAITGTGLVILELGPTIVAAANLAANCHIADKWRIVPTHGNGTTHTYTVTAIYK